MLRPVGAWVLGIPEKFGILGSVRKPVAQVGFDIRYFYTGEIATAPCVIWIRSKWISSNISRKQRSLGARLLI